MESVMNKINLSSLSPFLAADDFKDNVSFNYYFDKTIKPVLVGQLKKMDMDVAAAWVPGLGAMKRLNKSIGGGSTSISYKHANLINFREPPLIYVCDMYCTFDPEFKNPGNAFCWVLLEVSMSYPKGYGYKCFQNTNKTNYSAYFNLYFDDNGKFMGSDVE